MMSMRQFALCGIALIAPLPAIAQNTASLSCWESKKNGTFQTREAKTPIEKANSGAAYALVTAEASTDSGQAQFCKNKAQLFYAKDSASYRVVYEKPGLDDQGVGMRLLGWSRDGAQLLIELLTWGYDNDAIVSKSALVLDAATSQVRELPVDEAFQRLFGKDCEFDFSVIGWGAEQNVLLRVTKTATTTRYQQTFCVEKPTTYSFDQQRHVVSLSKAAAVSENR